MLLGEKGKGSSAQGKRSGVVETHSGSDKKGKDQSGILKGEDQSSPSFEGKGLARICREKRGKTNGGLKEKMQKTPKEKRPNSEEKKKKPASTAMSRGERKRTCGGTLFRAHPQKKRENTTCPAATMSKNKRGLSKWRKAPTAKEGKGEGKEKQIY